MKIRAVFNNLEKLNFVFMFRSSCKVYDVFTLPFSFILLLL